MALAVAACSAPSGPRRQIVLVIDTNAPVPGQLADAPELSRQAAVDTLRLEVLGNDGNVVDTLDVVAPDPKDWPVSFGIAGDASTAGPISVRVRAFAGALASVEISDGGRESEPRREVTLDRLLELAPPEAGIETRRVLLDEGCIGVPSRFLSPRRTCVSADRPGEPPTQGVTEGAPAGGSLVGTWQKAREIPCRAGPQAGRRCIRGGFSILGDIALTGFNPSTALDPVPLRPVLVTPFWMDETEFTVGRFRALVQSGTYAGALPFEKVPGDATLGFCTFLGPDRGDDDAFPLNCVDWDVARAVCAAAGGSLPTEAQWEHAARGRGEARAYPWGDATPACCTESVSRRSVPGVGVSCSGSGPELVRSHGPSPACGGIGDESRDHVFDLGGSVAELTLDSLVPYDGACWGPSGLLENPHCTDPSTTSHTRRGAGWGEGAALSQSALRGRHTGHTVNVGFRCAYEDAP